ncbi:3-hydroxyisobutyryl-CoA hydrolase [Corynebacterium yudongzhengii]|uniref:3-hydroxyisobutyryl-CoA hydrolase n=1 Tax=Corynebacterium yudongzhengii TaxID=2080740 RepID=A0A2U1T7X0_9CORY|nr:3-hydroxyisobutyryl-CoA hydrolase [Corynebacterium yudongzhengii]AWB82281.1 3-hydroxyisobutyryl-CoA hydrolase [Corynebacterium yudongzhengii]PWC02100.1 3-hydroxyisobutyryl-CoA hydrolase [Corynebacterium yudongzhengii]
MDTPVITSISNATGVIALNRPRALNSLNPEMVEIIAEALESWRDDDTVEQVLIHAPERGFCAGGDVRAAREAVLEGKSDEADQFFAGEYRLNNLLAEYPKPFAALADGVIMGGGQGISMHGSHRIVTENAFASMPEMAIGYITDVGMSYALQAITGKATGRFLALTGYRLKAEDMLHTGLATHVVDSPDIEALTRQSFDDVLADARTTAIDPPIARVAEDIEAVFRYGSWEEIDKALRSHDNQEFVELVDELIAGASKASLVATAELLAVNAERNLSEALDNELRLGSFMIRQPDFAEGVRAVLVDKTKDASFGDPLPASEYRQYLR